MILDDSASVFIDYLAFKCLYMKCTYNVHRRFSMSTFNLKKENALQSAWIVTAAAVRNIRITPKTSAHARRRSRRMPDCASTPASTCALSRIYHGPSSRSEQKGPPDNARAGLGTEANFGGFCVRVWLLSGQQLCSALYPEGQDIGEKERKKTVRLFLIGGGFCLPHLVGLSTSLQGQQSMPSPKQARNLEDFVCTRRNIVETHEPRDGRV